MNIRAQIRMLPDNRRLHMHDGPIDLIVEAFGRPMDIKAAYRAAAQRFPTVLDELCEELKFLRQPTRPDGPLPQGPIARRMVAAVTPYAATTFITPMAAVAGAVAEEILGIMTHAAELSRAYVNDGGDIALHLGPGERFVVGMMEYPRPEAIALPRELARYTFPNSPVFLCAPRGSSSLSTSNGTPRSEYELQRNTLFGTTTLDFTHPVRGIATSGWRGRSFSLGIADAVTVLADTAAQADAAATVIANAVDLPGHPAVVRIAANELQPDTDLADRPVTQGVGELRLDEIHAALSAGAQVADQLRRQGLIRAAALNLQSETRLVGRRNFGLDEYPVESIRFGKGTASAVPIGATSDGGFSR